MFHANVAKTVMLVYNVDKGAKVSKVAKGANVAKGAKGAKVSKSLTCCCSFLY